MNSQSCHTVEPVLCAVPCQFKKHREVGVDGIAVLVACGLWGVACVVCGATHQ